jgi:hypothetical protein
MLDKKFQEIIKESYRENERVDIEEMKAKDK